MCAVRTSNLAREAALAAGIPDKVPAHTVTQACISSNQAAAQGAALIEAGLATALIVGGAETMSDVPIRLSRPLRQRLLRAQKGIKGPGDVLKLVRGLRLGDLAPEAPAIAGEAGSASARDAGALRSCCCCRESGREDARLTPASQADRRRTPVCAQSSARAR